MDKKEYINVLYNPDALTGHQANALGSLIQQYPYLQSARALYLKVLYNAESYKYNSELKKTAAYTTDRSVLFDFITSEQFIVVKQPAFTNDLYITEADTVDSITKPPVTLQEIAKILHDSYEEDIATIPEDADMRESSNAAPTITETEEKLEIGRPLEFENQEKHSFREWLQLSRLTPVNRENEKEENIIIQPETVPVKEEDEAKNKKLEIIDKFIEANPKISPVKNAPLSTLNIERNSDDTSYLMTETLARVYLEQKKYQKAIQAYEILILKYPEKSIYFADLILDIKNLQQNNNN